MERLVPATALLLLSAGLAFSQSPRPKVQLDATEWNLGEVYNKEQASHSFKITNSGNKDLRIFGVSASCGCTAVLVGKWVLKSAESTQAEIRVEPKGGTGPFEQSALVRTNEPNRPHFTLTLRGAWVDHPVKKGEQKEQTKQGEVSPPAEQKKNP